MKKKKLIIIISIIVALLIIGSITTFLLLNKDSKKKDNDSKPKTEEKKKEEEQELQNETSEYYFAIYQNEYTTYTQREESYYDYDVYHEGATELGKYYCKSNECKSFNINTDTKQVLVSDDDKLYSYNYDTNTKKEIKLNGLKEEINSITMLNNSNGVYGYAISTNNSNYKYAYYNIKQNKFLTDFIFSYVYNFPKTADKGHIVVAVDINNAGVIQTINISNGEVINSYNDISTMEEKIINNKIFYVSSNIWSFDVYDENFKKIFEKDNTEQNSGVINSNDTITFANEKTFVIYDTNKTKLTDSTRHDKVIKAIKDYVIVQDGNSIKLCNLKDEDIVTIAEMKENYTVDYLHTNWYNHKEKDGIYVIINDNNEPDDSEQGMLEFYYIPKTKETGVLKGKRTTGGYAKPVLYLYPTTKTNIEVSFEKPELLTTTYPKFINSWNVTADNNGDLYDNNGNYYYGLYWEESGSTNVSFETGFYVTKDSAIDFLEEKLYIIGLNPRERNEFIMYWLPILEKNENNLVYFELTEERNNYNKLNISPTPDSLLRVAIHVKKVNKKVDIKEQKLTTFNRTGFVAVEWGGVIHN